MNTKISKSNKNFHGLMNDVQSRKLKAFGIDATYWFFDKNIRFISFMIDIPVEDNMKFIKPSHIEVGSEIYKREVNKKETASRLQAAYIAFIAKWHLKIADIEVQNGFKESKEISDLIFGIHSSEIINSLTYFRHTFGIVSVPEFLRETITLDLEYIRDLTIEPFGFEGIYFSSLMPEELPVICPICYHNFTIDDISVMIECPKCHDEFVM